MYISHNFTINDQNHVVFEDGTELGQGKAKYMYTQLLQSYDLEILLEVDKFCRKHDITYYLTEGTLLGAIRHKGFIPWDDDIDICMFREDYERFKKLASEEGISDGFVIDCELTNPNHWTSISQVEMVRPVPYLKKRLEGIALHNGPCIDVFPIDYTPTDDISVLSARKEKIHSLRRAMWIKSGLHKRAWYKTFKRRITLYYPLKLYGITKSLDDIRQKCNGLMKATNDSNGPFAVNFASLYDVDREVFPVEWFGEPRMVEFEGHMFPCPSESEKILERTYQNYLALPIVRRRKNKHFFSAAEEEILEHIDDPEVVAIAKEFMEYDRQEKAQKEAELEALRKQGIIPDKDLPPFIRRLRKKIRRAIGRVKNFKNRRIYDLESRNLQNAINNPVKEKTVLFDSFSGLGILDSPRAIFKRMLEREEFQDYEYIWAIKDRSIVGENLEEFENMSNVSIVSRTGDEYQKAIASAKYLISNSSFPMTFARKKDQLYLNTWHGVPTKSMGYERPGQKVISTKNVVRNYLNATHIVSANDFTADTMYKKAYKLDGIYEGKLLDSPLPRTDAIYNTDRDYIMGKLAAAGINTEKKIIVYAPTWKGANYKDFDKDTDELRNAVNTLRSMINSDEYEVFLRVHYFLYRAIDADPELSKICIPFTIDTNELLSVTEILISDYSSIFFDFLGTRRPILFYVPDLEKYENERGLYVPMKDMPGPVGTTIEEIAGFINDLENVTEKYKEKYQKMYDWCSSKEDGKACDNIIDSFILGKEHPLIDCSTKKKKLLVMSEWGKDFPARNELEKLFLEMDYDRYDVTLLAGAPKEQIMSSALEHVDEHVRILINNRKVNVERSIRKKAYDGVKSGSMTPVEAAEEMDIEREWQRLVGDACFDELVLVQPEGRALELWLILAAYAPVVKKSFVISARGAGEIYSIESNMDYFSKYKTINEYSESLL